MGLFQLYTYAQLYIHINSKSLIQFTFLGNLRDNVPVVVQFVKMSFFVPSQKSEISTLIQKSNIFKHKDSKVWDKTHFLTDA